MKRFSAVFAFAAALALSACLPAPVPAAETGAAAVTGGQAFATMLNQTVFPIVSALFLGFLSWALKKLGNRWHLEALTKQNNMLEQLAFQGVTLAEEYAANLAGSKSQLTGNDKLDIALTHIFSVMPKVSEEQANRVVHSILARTVGVGSTRETAIHAPGALLAGLALPAHADGPLEILPEQPA